MSSDLAIDLHKKYFGTAPKVMTFAPGRINLIGEHTDYNGGFVMPAAVNYGIWVTGRVVDGETRMISSVAGTAKTFCANTTEPGDASGWAKYPAGMAWVLREKFGPMPNVECAVYSTLPTGSGVSSSAAIEMAYGMLWKALVGFEVTPTELALLGQKCENQYVGVNCGIMDQMASACGKANSAVFIDTRSLQYEYASVSDQYAVMLLDTKKPRALTTSAYNERRSQCEEAAKAMGVELLRDANLSMLASSKGKLEDVVYRRAKHVITENNRCEEFRSVLGNDDREGIFALMKGSHDSLRDDYEVSCDELDAMAESAWVSPGVVGARMTGAGFGGACVALVEKDSVSEFTSTCLQGYEAKTGQKGEILECSIDDGARILMS
ncbi:MAG: galactokinase [Armatimonadetes bacterium]|nr:galactokinase [Armatimonadota bacterium]